MTAAEAEVSPSLVSLHLGDCLDVMKQMADGSVDAVVTDPPAGIGFMGKDWDGDKGGREQWVGWMTRVMRECLRLLKPGGHALVWALPRTSHWTATAVEDAGFEVRDVIVHLFGQGFPKSLDVSKVIARRRGGPKAARAAVQFMRERREALGLSRVDFENRIFGRSDGNVRNWEEGISLPEPGLWTAIKAAMELGSTPFDGDMERGDELIAREEGNFGYQKDGERWVEERELRTPTETIAMNWSGWGTALKPASEHWILARKPLDGTVAANVVEHGVGALNIDGCRIACAGNDDIYAKNIHTIGGFGHAGANVYGKSSGSPVYDPSRGRWPANVTLDEEAAAILDEQSGVSRSGVAVQRNGGGQKIGNGGVYNRSTGLMRADVGFNDAGGASRFFYCAKASPDERKADAEHAERHPTVKPLALMRWLCRLVTPPGGLVLDPFAGSGSTLVAAVQEGFRAVGVESESTYFALAERRALAAKPIAKQLTFDMLFDQTTE